MASDNWCRWSSGRKHLNSNRCQWSGGHRRRTTTKARGLVIEDVVLATGVGDPVTKASTLTTGWSNMVIGPPALAISQPYDSRFNRSGLKTVNSFSSLSFEKKKWKKREEEGIYGTLSPFLRKPPGKINQNKELKRKMTV